MADAIVEMSSKGFGCVGVFDAAGALVGIITDGDLRRHLRAELLVDTPVEEVMTRSPRTIPPDALVAEALEADQPQDLGAAGGGRRARSSASSISTICCGSAPHNRRDAVLALAAALWQKPPRRGPGVIRPGRNRCRSSVVEHSIGNGEVDSSILSGSTIFLSFA